MELDFKPDLNEARALWRSFWDGTNSRPHVCSIAPRPDRTPVTRPNPYAMAFHDPKEVIDRALEWAATHTFVAETVPWYEISFGPDHLAVLLGAELMAPESGGETTWARPVVEDWESFPIRFDERGQWWRRTVECIRAFRRRCEGKLLLSVPPLHSGLDGLAALRGTENLMIDLALEPEKVERALRQLEAATDQVRALFHWELGLEEGGYVNRYGMYSEEPMAVLQCDSSCMIGPQAFAAMVAPDLRHESSVLSRAVYHLDGPGAVQHLDAVCAIERIHGVQWKPTAPEESANNESLRLYRRIRAAGKSVVVMAKDSETIRRVAGELLDRGAHYNSFHQSVVRSADEAHDLIAFLDRVSRGQTHDGTAPGAPGSP